MKLFFAIIILSYFSLALGEKQLSDEEFQNERGITIGNNQTIKENVTCGIFCGGIEINGKPKLEDNNDKDTDKAKDADLIPNKDSSNIQSNNKDQKGEKEIASERSTIAARVAERRRNNKQTTTRSSKDNKSSSSSEESNEKN